MLILIKAEARYYTFTLEGWEQIVYEMRNKTWMYIIVAAMIVALIRMFFSWLNIREWKKIRKKYVGK